MRGFDEPSATDANGVIWVFNESGAFSFTGSTLWLTVPTTIPTPRDAAGAARGPNGLIYLVGGRSLATGQVSNAIEAYNPASNTWTAGLPGMATARTQLAVAAGLDGRIYALGGFGAAAQVATVEAYSIVSNKWTTLSDMPDVLDETTAVGGPDGRIYVAGGANATALGLVTVNAYSPVSNRWAPVAALANPPRYGIGLVVDLTGRIWAVGGSTNPEFAGEAIVQIYGPSVSVSPTAVPAGGTATVSGSNFAANANVSVYINSATGTPLATGTTNASGALNAGIKFTVPSLAGGEVGLIVVDDKSQYPITLDFRVQ
jgi:hypothetical protein